MGTERSVKTVLKRAAGLPLLLLVCLVNLLVLYLCFPDTRIEAQAGSILTEDLRSAIRTANEIAPEHLELCVDQPFDYLDLIRPFRDATDNKSRQLMETLEVFVLDAGLSSSKASRLMDVHVNTVQYRLKRIREMLGTDITAKTIVPGLMVALAVQRIEKEAGPF